VDERSQVIIATLLGAVVGGVFGCLYLTERGRRVREQLEPLFDTTIDELQQARKTIEKAREAVDEGRRTVDDVLHPPSSGSPWKSSNLRQASS
jgi:gas vesicle protein